METRTLEDWRALLEAEKTLDSGVYNKHDLLIVRGQGARVWDAEGNEYIDCVGGYGVANLGHGNPEVVEAVAGRVPVLVDSGFRRGTDIFKALALGARAVGIGRPYVWGLAAFGQEGVEAVLRMLKAELVMAMQTCATPRLRDVSRDRVKIVG